MRSLAHPEPSRPLPSPVKVFLDWLEWLPPQSNIQLEAARAVAHIDRRGLQHRDALALRTLLDAVAGPASGPKP